MYCTVVVAGLELFPNAITASMVTLARLILVWLDIFEYSWFFCLGISSYCQLYRFKKVTK